MTEYVTSEEMDAYAANRPDSSAWTGATEADQEDALEILLLPCGLSSIRGPEVRHRSGPPMAEAD